jgi:hypothetical protein
MTEPRELASSWDRNWYGFWAHEDLVTGRNFVFDEHIDESPPADIGKLLSYLKNAEMAIAAQAQPQKCLHCGGMVNNSVFRSDGVFLWPDSLTHFVEVHAFVLPDRLVGHIRAERYLPKPLGDLPVSALPWPK